MRELLSGALPAPQDEPPQRDVIDAAMEWGTRRRRRDWALSGAAALAVLAVGTGIAAMTGGSGSSVTAGGGPHPSATHRSAASPEPQGSWWTPYCAGPGSGTGDLAQYCELFNEEQNFGTDFAKNSVTYIQAALPQGFTVKATETWVLILTGPNGKTNYLFASAEPASTLDGKPLNCPPQTPCFQTSTAGGKVVVNTWPSGDPSAGYVGNDLKDPRVDILLGTSVTGAMNGVAAPTSAQPLLTNEQLAKILTDPGFLAYAKQQVQHQEDVVNALRTLAPPSASGASPGGASSSGSSSSWTPPTSSLSSPSSPSSPLGSISSPGNPVSSSS